MKEITKEENLCFSNLFKLLKVTNVTSKSSSDKIKIQLKKITKRGSFIHNSKKLNSSILRKRLSKNKNPQRNRFNQKDRCQKNKSLKILKKNNFKKNHFKKGYLKKKNFKR